MWFDQSTTPEERMHKAVSNDSWPLTAYESAGDRVADSGFNISASGWDWCDLAASTSPSLFSYSVVDGDDGWSRGEVAAAG